MFKRWQRVVQRWIAPGVAFHTHATCAHCGSQLAQQTPGADWLCPNPDCPPQVLQRVQLWASREALDIQGCDVAVVTQLVQRGLVRDAAEFYQLKIAELAALEGFDLVKARALWEAIQASKQREAWRVLFGLGIPNVGAVEAQRLGRHFLTVEDLFATSRERLGQLDGITDRVASSVTHWYGDAVNRKLVRRLSRAGVNLTLRVQGVAQ